MAQMRPPRPAAIVFDMYGTLVDVAGVSAACKGVVPDPEAFTALWRSKQLEYSFLRTLLGRYRDFWRVTQEALDFAVARFGRELSAEERGRLLDAWLHPAAYPDAQAALPRLAERFRLAVLSNGTPKMLRAGLRHCGLGPHIGAVLSVHGVRRYKPSPQVYRLATRRLRTPRRKILFVSANPFDVAGARSFGLRVCWINRTGAPLESLARRPQMVAADLDALATRLR